MTTKAKKPDPVVTPPEKTGLAKFLSSEYRKAQVAFAATIPVYIAALQDGNVSQAEIWQMVAAFFVPFGVAIAENKKPEANQ